MAFLTLDQVNHYYFSKESSTKALEEISFSVKEGELVSILGPSGCGKTTILSIIAGLIKQTEGSVLFKGKPTATQHVPIGYMLQQDYLFPWRTVMDNVLLGPHIQGKIDASTEENALQLLEDVGLANVSHDYPAALSGGMRQRAALVRTLITDPEILLLDEPFSALDYLTKLKLEDLVFKLLKTYQKTAILVTHDISEAISMSDHLLLMTKDPGTLAKKIQLPKNIREEQPFLVRRHQEYQAIFDQVWNDLNAYEKGGV